MRRLSICPAACVRTYEIETIIHVPTYSRNPHSNTRSIRDEFGACANQLLIIRTRPDTSSLRSKLALSFEDRRNGLVDFPCAGLLLSDCDFGKNLSGDTKVTNTHRDY